MNYEEFCKAVASVVFSENSEDYIWFDHDEESGLHTARTKSGVTFVGNSTSLKVTVRWGNSHQAQITLAA